MKSDPSWLLFASRTMLDRLGAVRERVEPVRNLHSREAVHQMRVATRRMRAALAVCDRAFGKKRRRAWRDAMRRVTRSLGAARDLDVQIEFVEHYLDEQADPDGRVGIERLRLRLNQRREKRQRRVVAAMDRFERSGVIDDMAGRLHAAIVSATQQGADDRGRAIFQQARTQVTARLDDLMAYRTYVDRPNMTEQLHAMRIVAKRLRYTMEVFAPLYDDALGPAIKAARRLQNRLGELHDCDLWIEQLPAFYEAEAKRHVAFLGHRRGLKRIQRDLDRLLANRQAARGETFDRFARAWRKFEDKGVWDDLRRRLDAAAEPAPTTPPPTDRPRGNGAGRPAAEVADPVRRAARPADSAN